MFVSKEAVPVTVDQLNFIFIKPKLNFGETKRVQRALLKATQSTRADGSSGDLVTDFDLSAYQVQLLIESVVSWSGPAFASVPLTAASLAELDPDDPLVVEVQEEIGRRNAKTKRENPKDSEIVGDAPSPEDVSWLATTISTSVSPSATNGRRTKSTT